MLHSPTISRSGHTFLSREFRCHTWSVDHALLALSKVVGYRGNRGLREIVALRWRNVEGSFAPYQPASIWCVWSQIINVQTDDLLTRRRSCYLCSLGRILLSLKSTISNKFATTSMNFSDEEGREQLEVNVHQLDLIYHSLQNLSPQFEFAENAKSLFI
jgi:hypothetical protein